MKTFINMHLGSKLWKIDSDVSQLRYFEEQLINFVQLKSDDSSLKNCQLSLNKTQNVIREYKDQLQNQQSTVTDTYRYNSLLKKQIISKEQALKECNMKLNDNEIDILVITQKEIIQQQEQNLFSLNNKNKKDDRTSCISFGSSNGVHTVKIPDFAAFPVL